MGKEIEKGLSFTILSYSAVCHIRHQWNSAKNWLRWPTKINPLCKSKLLLCNFFYVYCFSELTLEMTFILSYLLGKAWWKNWHKYPHFFIPMLNTHPANKWTVCTCTTCTVDMYSVQWTEDGGTDSLRMVWLQPRLRPVSVVSPHSLVTRLKSELIKHTQCSDVN